MPTKAKVLVLDIETSPLVVYSWGIKDQHIGLEQLVKDWHIMAWSAKWLDDPVTKVIYYDKRKYKYGNDKPILKPLWKLLNEADIVITQNGKAFDSRKINARFIFHKMSPPKPYKHLDTYLLIRSVAQFTSHKLSYLTEKLCKTHKKESHGKFAGWRLWSECLKGNEAAWDELKRYNIKDILSTEELYTKIKAWAPEHFPKVFPLTKKSTHCGTCAYKGKMIEGPPRHAQVYKYRQNRCPKCGAWQRGTKIK